jgi:hypothetical protein
MLCLYVCGGCLCEAGYGRSDEYVSVLYYTWIEYVNVLYYTWILGLSVQRPSFLGVGPCCFSWSKVAVVFGLSGGGKPCCVP